MAAEGFFVIKDIPANQYYGNGQYLSPEDISALGLQPV